MQNIMVASSRLVIKPSSIEEMQNKYEKEGDKAMQQAYLEMLECMKLNRGREEWASDWNIYLLDGTHVGGIGFKGVPDEEGKVEIGYGINEPFRRNGYATEAVGAMVKWALSNEDVRCVQAQTEDDNQISKKVIKKNGFIEVGLGNEGPLFEVR